MTNPEKRGKLDPFIPKEIASMMYKKILAMLLALAICAAALPR